MPTLAACFWRTPVPGRGDDEQVGRGVGTRRESHQSGTCPAGTTVVGPGSDIFNGGGKVALEQLLPDVSAGTVQVTAKETDAKAGD